MRNARVKATGWEIPPSRTCVHHRFSPLSEPTRSHAWPPDIRVDILFQWAKNLHARFSYSSRDCFCKNPSLSWHVISSFCILHCQRSRFFFFFFLYRRFPLFLLLNRYSTSCLLLFIWKCALLFLTRVLFTFAVLFLSWSGFYLPRSSTLLLLSWCE